MREWTCEECVERTGGEWETMRAACRILFDRGPSALPAVIAGLNHPNWRVRRACASLLDHLADPSAVGPLARVLKTDPIAAVRRNALHSLSCHDCKSVPLGVDVVGPVIDAALHDRSVAVRRRAVQYLIGQTPDTRAADAMQIILAAETDPILLQRARRALAWHAQHDTSRALSCVMNDNARAPWACGCGQ